MVPSTNQTIPMEPVLNSTIHSSNNIEQENDICYIKILNLSKRCLTDTEITILKKGLKFTATPKQNYIQSQSDMTDFCRKLRLNEMFNENDSNLDKPICRNNSNYNPPNNRNATLNDTIGFLTTMNNNLAKNGKHKTKKNNLSKNEQIALDNLKNDSSIIIKEADKGSTIVIMDIDYYHSKILKILNDRNTYKEENVLTDNKIKNKISDFACKFSLQNEEKKFLTNFENKIGNFYGRHKYINS